jgi:glycosyltransferase involved in cell wall biosynthesis
MSSRIKIAHLVLNLDLGGLEKLVVSFLGSLNRDEFDLTLGCLEGPGELAPEVEKMGIEITTFGRREGLDLKLVRPISGWLRRHKADILHTHNAAAHFYGSLAAKAARTKAVVHTKHGRDWPDKPRKVLLNRISSFLTTRIVTVSRNAFDVARDIERVPVRKISIIHNGIDTDLYRPASRPGRFADESAGKRLIGTVARLSPEKDQRTMIEAFDILARRIDDVRLVLAGDGPSRRELEALAASLPSRDRIDFLGAVGDVPALLRSLDVFLLTSTTEGIPLALLEAGASEVPAVVTDVGGNGEVVVDGETGFLVEPGDPAAVAEKTAMLLEDETLRADLGRKARARILEHFSLRGMTAEYETLYRECAKRS